MKRIICLYVFFMISILSIRADEPIDASTVLDAFKKNSLNASGTYKGNLCTIRGKVIAIEEDPVSRLPSIKMGEGDCVLLFLFVRDYKDIIAPVNAGDSVELEALCNGLRRTSGQSGKVIVFSESSMIAHSVAQKEEAPQAPAVEPEPVAEQNKAEDNDDKTDSKSKKKTSPSERKSKEKEDVPEQNIISSVITVEGKKGTGTGFVTEFDGRKAIITNNHVLFENNGVKLLSVNNTVIEPGEIYFAGDRDIAVIFLKDQSIDLTPLTIFSDMDSVKTGAPVVVYGNSMGAGVNTEIFGKVSGIGPKTIEVSAKFVPGNSGSPIILKGSDHVIGVATSAAVYKANWTNSGTRFTDVRRFGTRVDNLKKSDLQIFKDLDYKKDLILYNNMKDVCTAAYIVALSLQRGRPAPISTEEFPESQTDLLKLVKEWNQKGNSLGYSEKGNRIDSQNSSADSAMDFFKNRFQKMKTQIQKSFAEARSLRPSYSYVGGMCDEFSEFMTTVIFKELDKIDDSMKEYADTVKKKSGSNSGSSKRH